MRHKGIMISVGIAIAIVTALLLGSNQSMCGPSPWPMFSYDSLRSGKTPYPGPDEAVLKWSFQTGNIVHSSPVIGSDGTIYVGSDDTKVYALYPDGSLSLKNR